MLRKSRPSLRISVVGFPVKNICSLHSHFVLVVSVLFALYSTIYYRVCLSVCVKIVSLEMCGILC